MKQLFDGLATAQYGQIALIDVQDKDSYPQWPSENVDFIFGPKGVAVAALIDASVKIRVLEGDSPAHMTCYGTGIIDIGNLGILVGNIVANTVANISWSQGKTKVDIFANASLEKATEIVFVLNHA